MTSPEVRVRPGAGLVVRNGPMVAVVGASDDASTAAVDAVLDRIQAFDTATGSVGDMVDIARSAPAGTAVAMALLGAQVEIVLLGAVRSEAAAVTGMIAHEGSSVMQLVTVPDELERLSVALVDATAPANPRSTLNDGVVPGGGVEIEHVSAVSAGRTPVPAGDVAAAPTPPAPPPPGAGGGHMTPPAMPVPPPAPPAPAAAPAEPVPEAPVVNVLFAGDVVDDDHDHRGRAPLPESAEEMPEEQVAEKAVVRGLACGVGHVNRIEAPYCSSCGRRLQGTVNLVTGPRPSLGTLIFDDGTTFGLERGYVIGREPDHDPAVTRGDAQPLAIADPDRAVSRVHAEVRLVDWDTVVVDRGSANGTHIAAPDGTGWRRLEPDTPVLLADGWSVAVGRRTFVFQQR